MIKRYNSRSAKAKRLNESIFDMNGVSGHIDHDMWHRAHDGDFRYSSSDLDGGYGEKEKFAKNTKEQKIYFENALIHMVFDDNRNWYVTDERMYLSKTYEVVWYLPNGMTYHSALKHGPKNREIYNKYVECYCDDPMHPYKVITSDGSRDGYLKILYFDNEPVGYKIGIDFIGDNTAMIEVTGGHDDVIENIAKILGGEIVGDNKIVRVDIRPVISEYKKWWGYTEQE